MADTPRQIGKNFVLIPHVTSIVSKVRKAERIGAVQASIVMQRSAQTDSPFRTGTNSRSIRRKTRGAGVIVWTTSSYGFWLEVLDRTYEQGIKGYLRKAWRKGAAAYPGFIKKAYGAQPKVRPMRPSL